MTSNPFSTRHVRPGAIAFRLHDGTTVEQLIDRFKNQPRRWVSLIGPHGSGKSSLLESIRSKLPKNFQIDSYRLNSRRQKSRRPYPKWTFVSKAWDPETIVIVDGYEQLSWWSRWQLRSASLKHGNGLIVTGHRSLYHFPILWHTGPVVEDDRYVLQRLLQHFNDEGLYQEAVKQWTIVRQQYPSDMRESLMAMYDWWEEKKRPATI